MTELSRVKDSNSNPIAIPGGQVVGETIATTLYVSMCNHNYRKCIMFEHVFVHANVICIMYV